MENPSSRRVPLAVAILLLVVATIFCFVGALALGIGIYYLAESTVSNHFALVTPSPESSVTPSGSANPLSSATPFPSTTPFKPALPSTPSTDLDEYGFRTAQIQIRDETLDVELAETPQQLAKGLRFRETLAEDAGMLFIFPKPQRLSFWMKDASIPLSIAYIQLGRQNRPNSRHETLRRDSRAQPVQCRDLRVVGQSRLVRASRYLGWHRHRRPTTLGTSGNAMNERERQHAQGQSSSRLRKASGAAGRRRPRPRYSCCSVPGVLPLSPLDRGPDRLSSLFQLPGRSTVTKSRTRTARRAGGFAKAGGRLALGADCVPGDHGDVGVLARSL